ncbi:peptidoglycan-binding domain-containing protein [Pararhizobium sp.]|uniref:peptidoglycan-binding domain-containing protein n=1 Tax=Pararhizobium sp. TaxID=1977563 RepID=UPI003D12E89C
MLGYKPDNVRQFQADHRLDVDGDVGPKTRAALDGELVALIPGEMAKHLGAGGARGRGEACGPGLR